VKTCYSYPPGPVRGGGRQKTDASSPEAPPVKCPETPVLTPHRGQFGGFGNRAGFGSEHEPIQHRLPQAYGTFRKGVLFAALLTPKMPPKINAPNWRCNGDGMPTEPRTRPQAPASPSRLPSDCEPHCEPLEAPRMPPKTSRGTSTYPTSPEPLEATL
jgi:hypothetical protein